MATTYYLNINYVCNEHCIFCASDLTNNVRLNGRGAWVSLQEVRDWLNGTTPGPEDRVMVAGGEPTLHRELLPIVQLLSQQCQDVVIFSNGVRFADPDFARATVEAGITRFEIALFGATAQAHEAITCLQGSFERTLQGLQALAALRSEFDFAIEVRLLVSNQCADENPAIVRMIHDRVPGVDAFSLNRLILSDNAANTHATISWADARDSINEAARLVRQFGYELEFSAMPLCVFEADNAEYVRRQTLREAVRLDSRRWELRYFDPVLAAGQLPTTSSRSPLALLEPCMRCDYLSVCGRVEDWYAARYGSSGLHSVRL